MIKHKQLELIKRIMSLSDAGLVYVQNEYDAERYEEIRTISQELLGMVSDQPLSVINDFFYQLKIIPPPK